MRFDSIDIENYRQYKSLHITFPEKSGNDLHIIVASNGVGKTNLLNAINWCLYGDEPHLGDEDDALTICNHLALQEAHENGDKTAHVSVVIRATSGDDSIEYRRSCTVTTETLFASVPEFTVTVTPKTGDSEILSGENARDRVNQYTPQKIRQYFFFDGERLYNYFGPKQDTTHVKDSIYEIAQINVVSLAHQHLRSIVESYQRELSRLSPDLSGILAQIRTKEAEKEGYEGQVASLRAAVEHSTSEIARLSEMIAGSEHVVEDKSVYERNIAQIEEDEAKCREIKAKLYTHLREYYVLLMFYRPNQATNDYIAEKFRTGKLPPDINVEMIRKSLDSHECVLCGQATPKDVETHLLALLQKFEFSPAASHKLMEIKNDVERFVTLAKLYRSKKEELLEDYQKAEERIRELTAENEKRLLRIRASSSVDQVADWIEQRNNHRSLIPINTDKITSYESRINDLAREISAFEEKKQKAIEDIAKNSEVQAELEFATRAMKIVAEIESEIVGEVRSQMEKETMELFHQLIWRKNTYGRIELDDNYRLKLYHKVTNESCLGSCSAAERELLALAFTIALHRVSGHDSLLFIDTPVGRVSDDNREYFAQKLIEVSATKQLILAFTPSEYSEEIRKYFTPERISSYYTMKSDNEESTHQEGGK